MFFFNCLKSGFVSHTIKLSVAAWVYIEWHKCNQCKCINIACLHVFFRYNMTHDLNKCNFVQCNITGVYEYWLRIKNNCITHLHVPCEIRFSLWSWTTCLEKANIAIKLITLVFNLWYKTCSIINQSWRLGFQCRHLWQIDGFLFLYCDPL